MMDLFFRATLWFATKEELYRFHADYVPLVRNARQMHDIAVKNGTEEQQLRTRENLDTVVDRLRLYEKHLARKGCRVITQARCR
jgi:hypothetical protein